MTPDFSLLGLWQADLRAGLDSVGTAGRVSTPGRPVYIELTVPSQTHWHRQVLVRGSCPLSCMLFFIFLHMCLDLKSTNYIPSALL